MTNNKSWIWRRKSSDKSTAVAGKVEEVSKGNEEEIHMLLAEKTELEKDLQDLNEKLSEALSECDAKDDLAKKHAKTAQEALAGWEGAEAKAVSIQQELNKAVQNRVASEERTSQLDAALKECVQQLRFVREEQEQRIHDVLTKAMHDFEKSQSALEDKLGESTNKIAKLRAENARLSKAILLKEQLSEELSQEKTKVDAEYTALLTRLESAEKENTSLRYEVRMLEKELDIRNEEREFNRRTADAVQKQQVDNIKKIAKLESECQKLRVLVRKRLPGPAALAKMKNEVDLLERGSADTRRRRPTASHSIPQLDYAAETYPESPGRKINILTERLCILEEENSVLRETLHRKGNELQLTRNMYAQTASRLSQVEAQLEESSKGQTTLELTRSSATSHDVSMTSISDIASDAGSWACALISELEHFREGKLKGGSSRRSVGASEISLMDDFVEMEKLALVCVDRPTENPPVKPSSVISDGCLSGGAGKEIVAVTCPDFSSPISDGSLSEITGKEIIAVTCPDFSKTAESDDQVKSSIHGDPSDSLFHSLKQEDMSPLPDSSETGIKESAREKYVKIMDPNMRKSISKLVEVIEGIKVSSQKDGGSLTNENLETPTGFMVRVFQWKTSELARVLHSFLRTCSDLLNGNADFENFTQVLTSTVEWILDHCFSLKDVSSMKDAIKKQLDWDESRSECDLDARMTSELGEAEKSPGVKEWVVSSCLSPIHGHNDTSGKDECQNDITAEIGRLKDELKNMESVRKDLENRLQSTMAERKSLTNQLQQSEKTIADLEEEIKDSKHMARMFEDQKYAIEDLSSQLSTARVELDESRGRLSSLEAEVEKKDRLCKELQVTCPEFQVKPESAEEASSKEHVNDEEKQLRADWEITAASEKLAQCQETILNLGKQLKALTSPRDVVLFDKVVPSPNNAEATVTEAALENRKIDRRSSLLDQMLAEDGEEEQLESPKTKEIICTSGPPKSPTDQTGINNFRSKEILLSDVIKHSGNIGANGTLAIVPKKRKNGGLLKKLLWRKNKSSTKKFPLPFDT